MTTATMATMSGFQIGDILSSTWGYDAVNVDFFKIIGISKSGNQVQVQKIKSTEYMVHALLQSRGCGLCGSHPLMIPSDEVGMKNVWDPKTETYTRKPIVFRRKIQSYKQGNNKNHYYIMINSYAGASKWNGQAIEDYNHH